LTLFHPCKDVKPQGPTPSHLSADSSLKLQQPCVQQQGPIHSMYGQMSAWRLFPGDNGYLRVVLENPQSSSKTRFPGTYPGLESTLQYHTFSSQLNLNQRYTCSSHDKAALKIAESFPHGMSIFQAYHMILPVWQSEPIPLY